MVPVRWPTALAVGSAVLVGATSLSAQPTYTVIANLGDIGGDAPLGGVIRGADGALYGTTSEGGAQNCGLIYRIDPAGTLSRVHEFSLPDGCKPVGELALGPDGGLYGVASDYVISGGRPVGYGSIYKVDADGAFTVLHRFVPAMPGDPEPYRVPSTPYAGLMLAPDGFFYGTARSADIYRISPDGAFAVIHGFVPPPSTPNNLEAALTMGSDGYLYSSSPTFELLVRGAGGTYFRVNTAGDVDWGVSFFALLNNDGSIFSPQGAFPSGEVAAGPDGEIYGNNRSFGPNRGDTGTILRLRPGGDVVVLYAFAAGVDQAYSDGADPQTGLILGSDGYVYGTTSKGGANGNGTIFRMSRAGGLATLRSFAQDGFSPTKGRLLEAAPGVFYGTAPSATGGVVYELRVADALLAESRLVTTNEDQTVEGVLTATGAGPSATFALVSDGSRGVATIDPVTGAFTYTPDADVNGSDSFTFSVTDGTQQSNLATVTVQIRFVNDPPVALDSSLTTPENTPVEGTLSAQDRDDRIIFRFAIVATPTKGTVELTPFSNRFTYTPAPGATGADSFTFQASDSQLDSNIATVSITIVPVPLAVSLVAPVGGDKLFVGIPTTSQWIVSGAVRVDLLLARRGGRSFDPIPECTGLAGTSSGCTWTPTGPPTQRAQLRVVAYSASGDSVSADTGEVRISAASPRLTLRSPHGRATIAIGTVQTIAWTHNLGARSLIRVELSRDGGTTWEVIAAAVQNLFDHDGAVNWLVSGPPTSTALLRVTSLSTNVSDVTNRVFTIAVSETPP